MNSERNNIQFSAPSKQVEDSILKLNSLMCKLPADPKDAFFKNCFVERNGDLILSRKNMGKIDSLNLETVSAFTHLTAQEVKSIVSILKFLQLNGITGNIRSAGNCYTYFYRTGAEDDYYYNRYLIIKDVSCEYLFNRYSIVDSSGNILLLKAKD